MTKPEMKQVFEWLRRLKLIHRISYDAIGQAIGYSGVGTSKAIKNETLSFDQIKEIAEKTGYKEDFDKHFQTGTNKVISSEELRFEDLIAKRVIEDIKPYLVEFQEAHVNRSHEMKDIIDLLGKTAVQLSRLTTRNEQLKKEIEEIKKFVADTHSVIAGS